MILLKDILLDGGKVNIVVDGGRIARILPSGADLSPYAGAETMDCSGKAVIPGFINMHTHAAMSLMRGIREDVSFHDWLAGIWDIEAHLDEEFVYLGTKAACLEMIKSGTTTFNDQYWFAPAAREAAREMGIRPVISYVILDQGDGKEAARQREQCERMYEDSLGWDDGAVFAVSVHAVYSVSEAMVRWASDFARANGLMLHLHLSETKKENHDCIERTGLTPTAYFDRLGVWGPHVVAAHALWLSDEDIEILGRNRVSCVHNVNSNLKLASGYHFRYNELRDAGVNLCIGTDGAASSNNLDMLEAMKTTALLQKAFRHDPAALPLPELLAMATVNGARAIGIDGGVIAEGKIADLSIVDTDDVRFLSPGSFLGNLVYSAHSDCIDSVIAGGRFVMKHRVVPGEKAILSEGREKLRKILPITDNQ